MPRGGPDGGDGGRGGSIYLRADRNINTLIDYRYARIHRAKRGENGRGADQYGRGAEDIMLRVPVGTVISDAETGEPIADLAVDGQVALVAKGGQGGLGNIHFKSSTNRAPRQSTPGEKGEQRMLRLELKVLADVGLLGMPNAGKSTLIRAISAARPKVADYPFTTLAPNLGVVRVDENKSFVVADIPGLDRRRGRRRGPRSSLPAPPAAHAPAAAHRRHGAVRRRASIPSRMRAPSSRNSKRYDPALAEKPRWLVLNKLDLVAAERTRAARCGVRQVVSLERTGVCHDRDQRRRLPRARLCDLRVAAEAAGRARRPRGGRNERAGTAHRPVARRAHGW